MVIDIAHMGGIAPRVSPDKLPEGMAQSARNVRLGSGALEPFRGLAATAQSVDNYAGLFMLYRFGQAAHWLEFATRKSVVYSPTPDDTRGRIYWSGDPDVSPADSPLIRMSDYTLLAPYGVINEATQSVTVGMPAPADNQVLTAINYFNSAKQLTYDAGSAYALNSYCIYGGALYICSTAITTPEAWNAGHWTAVTTADPTRSQVQVGSVFWNGNWIPLYEPADYDTHSARWAFKIGDIVSKGTGNYYQCLRATDPDESWNPDKWWPVVGAVTTAYAAGSAVVAGDHRAWNGQTWRCVTGYTTGTNLSDNYANWSRVPGSATSGYTFTEYQTYALTEVAIYNQVVYSCVTAVTVPAAWGTVSSKFVADVTTVTEFWRYCYTLISDYGEESPNSPASNEVQALLTDIKIGVTGIPNAATHAWAASTAYVAGAVVVSGGICYVAVVAHTSGSSFDATKFKKVAYLRLYRLNMGTSSSAYQVVTDIALPATDGLYTDTMASAALGSVLPSGDWYSALSGYGVITLANGCIAFYYERSVYLSLPYLPHAVPVGNRYTVDSEIMGLASFGTSLYVITKGMPVLLSGSDPAAMVPEKAEQGYACVSRQSVVDLGYAVIYAAPVGLVMAGQGKSAVITGELVDIPTWESWQPETMRAWQYRGCYLATSPTVTFLFDPSAGSLITLNITPDGGFYDERTGALFFNMDGTVKEFDADAAHPLTVTWRSRRYLVPRGVHYLGARVVADAYPVQFTLLDNGSSRYSVSVLADRPFRLPAGIKVYGAEIEVSGSGTIRRVQLATSYGEM